jgi:hypothetical protein
LKTYGKEIRKKTKSEGKKERKENGKKRRREKERVIQFISLKTTGKLSTLRKKKKLREFNVHEAESERQSWQ